MLLILAILTALSFDVFVVGPSPPKVILLS